MYVVCLGVGEINREVSEGLEVCVCVSGVGQKAPRSAMSEQDLW